MFSLRWISPLLTGLFLIAGCSGGGDPTAPPDGWQTTEMRWWAEGVDTSEVFRNLESLSAMGVLDEGAKLQPGGTVSQEQFNTAIKQSLVRLYRNNPMVVDSLFEEYAAPKLENADLSGEIVEESGKLKTKILENNKKAAYDAISEYFREPERTKSPDNIMWPDSLRSSEYTGVVELQVHLGVEGEGDNAVSRPDAVEVLSGTHPTLNKIALRAATQAVWQPAYLLRDGNWTPVDSWVRFSIPFQMR